MRCLRFDPKMDQRAVTISNGTVFASAVADRNTNLKRWSPPFVNGKFIHGRMCSSAEQMMGQIVTDGPPQQTVKVERLITSFFLFVSSKLPALPLMLVGSVKRRCPMQISVNIGWEYLTPPAGGWFIVLAGTNFAMIDTRGYSPIITIWLSLMHQKSRHFERGVEQLFKRNFAKMWMARSHFGRVPRPIPEGSKLMICENRENIQQLPQFWKQNIYLALCCVP